MTPKRQRVVVLIAMLMVLCGCRPTVAVDTSAQKILDQLQVINRPNADPGYRRAAFGAAWADVDHDGCNTRDQVLFSTLDKHRPFAIRRQGRCPTDVVAGTWIDLYGHGEMTWTDLKNPVQAQSLPLDHILSLAGAWRYGARDWTEQQRLEFANDPLNLQPTTAAANREKSDYDPATWTPPRAGRCGYATRYIAVKTRYALPVDRREKAALQLMLETCST